MDTTAAERIACSCAGSASSPWISAWSKIRYAEAGTADPQRVVPQTKAHRVSELRQASSGDGGACSRPRPCLQESGSPDRNGSSQRTTTQLHIRSRASICGVSTPWPVPRLRRGAAWRQGAGDRVNPIASLQARASRGPASPRSSQLVAWLLWWPSRSPRRRSWKSSPELHARAALAPQSPDESPYLRVSAQAGRRVVESLRPRLNSTPSGSDPDWQISPSSGSTASVRPNHLTTLDGECHDAINGPDRAARQQPVGD